MILAFVFGYIIYLASIATGKVSLLELVVVAIFFVGSIFVLLVVNSAFQDIQQIRNSKDLLEERNFELQRVNTQLDSFLYSTAHDLRAPLATILGLIDLGKRTNQPFEKDRYFTLMSQTVNSMELLLKEIIGITKNKHLKIKQDLVRVDSLVESVISELEPVRFEDLEIKVEIEFNEEIWLDAYRVKSILYNLISNSFRFCDKEKNEKWVRIKITKSSSNLGFIVADNGVGIEKAYQTKVFEMFYRASSNSIGSGLGLYLTREIVYMLGGNLTLSSRPGIGTEIIVNLPYPLATAKQIPIQIL